MTSEKGAYKHLLSVVIVSKNEEQIIGECIESVLKAARGLNAEVMLIDAKSTDRTVEIAVEYPIKIYQLNPAGNSAAANRFIGSSLSSGKYIQFIDGDMTIDENWLRQAISFMEKNNDCAGVGGRIMQDKSRSHWVKKFRVYFEEKTNVSKPTITHDFFGAALFRTESISEAGPHDPYMVALEEAELCDRINAKGYKLITLPYKMVYHHIRMEYPLFFELRKNLKFTRGKGQIMRRSISRETAFKRCLNAYAPYFIPPIMLLILAITLLTNPSLNHYTAILIPILFVISLVVMILKKHSIKYGFIYSITLGSSWLFFLIGLLEPVRVRARYLDTVKVIELKQE